VMDCPKAAIFELDEEKGLLTIRAWEGLSDAYAEGSRSVDIHSSRAVALLAGEAIPVSDIFADPEMQAIAALAKQEGYRAFMDVPLRSREHTLGVLSAYYAEVREFAPSEIEMMLSFADQAAVALETARLLQEQERRIIELSSLEPLLRGTRRVGNGLAHREQQTAAPDPAQGGRRPHRLDHPPKGTPPAKAGGHRIPAPTGHQPYGSGLSVMVGGTATAGGPRHGRDRGAEL